MAGGSGRTLALMAVGAVLLALPPFLPAYPLTLLTQALIYAVFAMSLDLLLGYTGLPSLGHAAYFGVAAYVVAILTTEHQAGFWTCLLLGVLVATPHPGPLPGLPGRAWSEGDRRDEPPTAPARGRRDLIGSGRT